MWKIPRKIQSEDSDKTSWWWQIQVWRTSHGGPLILGVEDKEVQPLEEEEHRMPKGVLGSPKKAQNTKEMCWNVTKSKAKQDKTKKTKPNKQNLTQGIKDLHNFFSTNSGKIQVVGNSGTVSWCGKVSTPLERVGKCSEVRMCSGQEQTIQTRVRWLTPKRYS